MSSSHVRGPSARATRSGTGRVVKLLFAKGERTVIQKVREVLLAYELESHADKERVLETYLNLVPAGSTATASPPPAAPSGGSAAPSAAPTTGSGSTTSSTTPLLLGVGAVVALVAVGLVVMRRGRATATGEDE